MATSAVFAPNSASSSLSPPELSYSGLRGSWKVIASTLPLWKGKKNVVISYSAIPGEPETTLDDLVQYHKVGAAAGTKASEVRGVDRVEADSPNGACWKWRGKGWLVIATSHWQVLSYSLVTGEEYVVTYFSSTLFTPAGLDIYSRKGAPPLPQAKIEELKSALIGVGGEVATLMGEGGGKMFAIPHDEE